eukprot:scaffold17602_cov140-Isochrysis_galbana.AAC.1
MPAMRLDAGPPWRGIRTSVFPAPMATGFEASLEPDEHGLLSEQAVTQAMAHIIALAAENDALRARNAELLGDSLAAHERAAQLEVEVRGGGSRA